MASVTSWTRSPMAAVFTESPEGTAKAISAFKTWHARELEKPAEKPSSLSSTHDVLEERKRELAMKGRYRVFTMADRPCSTTPLSSLKRVEVKSLKLRKRHDGKYLLLRVIAPFAFKSPGTFIGQDPSGQAVRVELRNVPWASLSSTDELNEMVPLGSVLILREPFFEVAAAQQGPTVSVHSVSDVIFVDEDRDLAGLAWKDGVLEPQQRRLRLEPADALSRGQELSAKGWRFAAERLFSDGLSVVGAGEHVDLRLARSEVRFETGLWRSSLHDAQTVLALSRSTIRADQYERALLRAATAEYELQLWGSASARYEKLAAIGSSAGREGFARTAARLKESKTGEYEWTALFNSSRTSDTGRLDIADYVAPCFEVADRKGKGRGLVATKHIPAGELLLMVRPIASCHESSFSPTQLRIRPFNLHSEIVEPDTHFYLTQKLILRLMDDPSLGEALDLLAAGPSYPCPPSFSTARLKPKGEVSSRPLDIDGARLQMMRTINAIRIKRLTWPLQPDQDEGDYSLSQTPRLSLSSQDRPVGLYGLPSLANHSCVPNTFVGFLGEHLFIRVVRALEPGDEITISYTVGVPFPQRSKTLATKYGFVCDCALCEQERVKSRQQHWARVLKLRRFVTVGRMPEQSASFWNDAYVRTSDQIMLVLSTTYSPADLAGLRPQLWPACHLVAEACFQLLLKASLPSQIDLWSERASKWAGLAAASCGWGRRSGSGPAPDGTPQAVPFEWQEGVVASLLLMAGALKLAVPDAKGADMTRRLAQKAVDVDRICVSGPGLGGRALFLHRYGTLLTAYGLTSTDVL